MKYIEKPRAILLAKTVVDEDGMSEFLTEVGAHVHHSDCALHNAPADEPGPCDCGMDLWETDAPSGAEELIEVAGRSCYRSFRPELNPNLSKVREGNRPYLGNILDSRHGSVLVHGNVTFAFVGVSRVFTHELVRHAVGTGFSQESLRYVRLEELTCWYPDSFGAEVLEDLHDALVRAGQLPGGAAAKEYWVTHRAETLRAIWEDTFECLENVQERISNELLLNELPGEFHVKKSITSAMRRLAPMGLGTAIVMTGNHRAWRNIIEQRTTEGAEEEIRIVFDVVARKMKDRYPNLYQDMELLDDGSYHFKNSNI